MVSFRKRTGPGEASAAIAGFWRWWAQARPRVEASVDSGAWDDLTDEVAGRVHAIHPKLEWEFCPGRRARHCLVVSPAGDAALRATAARWRATAPPEDHIWEYHAARQPDPTSSGMTMQIAGAELALDEMRFAFEVDADRSQIDVVGYHRAFASLPEKAVAMVTFLTLDWLLGEDGVELWIGRVEWRTTPPAQAQLPSALGAAVAELAAQHQEPTWAVLSAQRPGEPPVIATVQQPLKAVRWPRFDTHVGVVLPYRSANDAALPADGSLDALRDFSDRLDAALGDDAELVAHESTRGRRTLHYYVDSSTAAVATIEQSLAEWREGKPSFSHIYDPSFDRVAHLST